MTWIQICIESCKLCKEKKNHHSHHCHTITRRDSADCSFATSGLSVAGFNKDISYFSNFVFYFCTSHAPKLLWRYAANRITILLSLDYKMTVMKNRLHTGVPWVRLFLNLIGAMTEKVRVTKAVIFKYILIDVATLSTITVTQSHQHFSMEFGGNCNNEIYF